MREGAQLQREPPEAQMQKTSQQGNTGTGKKKRKPPSNEEKTASEKTAANLQDRAERLEGGKVGGVEFERAVEED
eukprot:1588194-Rhodomonas_salina.1